MNIYFLSGNKSKIEEVERVLGKSFKSIKLDLKEIQDIDINKVVEEKLLEAYSHVKSPVFVDDVGLYIKAWKGFPGPFIKFIDVTGGMKLLINMMSNTADRSVSAKTIIGYYDGKQSQIFESIIEGTIAKEIRGTNGFGWDSIFIPNGSKKTYAEMSNEEKDSVSGRKMSLLKFKKYLDLDVLHQ